MRTRATRNWRGKARLPLLERLEDRTVPSVLPLTPSFPLVGTSFTTGQSAAAPAGRAESLPPGLEKQLGRALELGQKGGESMTSAASGPAVSLTESDSARPSVRLVVLVIDLVPASSTSSSSDQAPAGNSTTTADASLTAQASTVATALSAGLPSAGASPTTSSSDSLTATTPATGTTQAGNTTTPANATPATTTSFSAGFVLVGDAVAGQLVASANTSAVVPPSAVAVPGADSAAQSAPATAVRLTGGASAEGDWLLEAPARQAPDNQPGEAPAPMPAPVPVPGKETPDDVFTDPVARDAVRALPEKPADPVAPADEAAAEREVPAADVRPEGVAEEENAAVFDLGRDEGPEATADFFPPELAAVTAADQLLESAEALTAGEGGWWNYLGAVALAATATASEVLRRRARLAEEEEGIDEETLVARLDRPWA